MSVLSVLVVRAMVSICVFVSFFIQEESIPWATLYTFLMCYCAVVFIVYPTAKSSSGTLFGYLCFLSLVVNSWVWMETRMANIHIMDFVIDNAMPYIKYRQILTVIAEDLANLTRFLAWLKQHLGVSVQRILIFITYLCGHALTFLFLLDIVYVSAVSVFMTKMSENFFSTFNVNTSESNHPEGYLINKMLDSKSYILPVLQARKFATEENETCQLLMETKTEDVVNNKGHRLPYQYERLYRYPGEDVSLTCSFRRNKYSLDPLSVFWTRNDSPIGQSSRYFVNLTHGEEADDEFKTLSTKLDIKMLQSDDFGVYKCIYGFETIRIPYELELRYVIAVFDIQPIKQKTILLYKEVGSLVSICHIFFYHFLGEEEDIYIDYTINSKNIDLTCPGFSTNVCSIGAGFLQGIHYFLASEMNNVFPHVSLTVLRNDLLGAKVSFCLCGRAYGVHRVTFVRKVYLSDGRIISRDVLHPFSFVILPHAKVSLFRYFNDSELNRDVEEMIEKGISVEHIEAKIRETTPFRDAIESKVLFEANVVQICVTLITVYVILFSFLLSAKLYCKCFIRFPAQHFIIRAAIAKPQLRAIEHFIYDVFLSHADSESEFVKDVLLPYLEIQCGHKVCFPERDFTWGRPEIGQYTENITKSRKLITILSEGYGKDLLCYRLQLEHVILPSLYESKRLDQDILFILYGAGSRFPDVLRWNDAVQKLDWQSFVTEKAKLDALKRWLDTGSLK